MYVGAHGEEGVLATDLHQFSCDIQSYDDGCTILNVSKIKRKLKVNASGDVYSFAYSYNIAYDMIDYESERYEGKFTGWFPFRGY